MTKSFFITGTNTDSGKTFATTALLNALNQAGQQTIGLKPVASGCCDTRNGLRNEDALQLQAAASIKLPYHDINPYAFLPPIAPHLAAEEINQTVNTTTLTQHYQTIKNRYSADYILIEGAGGWLVPLNDKETFADYVHALHTPVIFVVELTLGCLNHALLTWQAMQQSNTMVAGWIANCRDPDMLALEKNLATLKQWIKAAFLGKIPYLQDKNISQASQYLTLTPLFNDKTQQNITAITG